MKRFAILAVSVALLLLAVPSVAADGPPDEICVDEVGVCVDPVSDLVEKYKQCLYWPSPSYCPTGGPPL